MNLKWAVIKNYLQNNLTSVHQKPSFIFEKHCQWMDYTFSYKISSNHPSLYYNFQGAISQIPYPYSCLQHPYPNTPSKKANTFRGKSYLLTTLFL